MSETLLVDELAHYVRFEEPHRAALAALGPKLDPGFPGIVNAFYEAIERTSRARAVFADEAQIARQKVSLLRWLRELFAGRYDAAYVASRARVGQAHVRIKLDQSFVVSAMSVVRAGLHDLVRDLPRDELEIEAELAHDAVDLICDLDLAIMLETYRVDYVHRIRTSEQLATLGQLAATIGHELRNPLAVMETSLHLLTTKLPADPKVARHATRLGEQIDLCGSIVRDLLDLARDRPPERAWVEIGDIVASALSEIPNGEGITRVLDVPGPVHVDGLQLRQLISNLVMNSLQAAKSPSGVTLRSHLDGHELHVVVEDDGPGLTQEALTRLFEPLFTTRARGVGLGLALCRRIAEKHGGAIMGGNRPEGGARFDVRFAHAAPNGSWHPPSSS